MFQHDYDQTCDQTSKCLTRFHAGALVSYLNSIAQALHYHASLLEGIESSTETAALLLAGANSVERAAERISHQTPEREIRAHA
jgi:hypothetical protein